MNARGAASIAAHIADDRARGGGSIVDRANALGPVRRVRVVLLLNPDTVLNKRRQALTLFMLIETVNVTINSTCRGAY